MSGQGTRAEIGRDSLAELFTGSSNFVERVPMLRVAFDRAAIACTADLAAASEQPPQMTLQGIESGVAADLLIAHEGKSAVAILHAATWNARLLASADRGAVFAIVETMLGGDGSQQAAVPERPLSRIEVRVVGAFFERVRPSARIGLRGRRRYDLCCRRGVGRDRLRHHRAPQQSSRRRQVPPGNS